MISKTIVVAIAVAMSACAARTQNGTASSVAASSAAFDQYATFSFGFSDPPEPGYQVTTRSLEVQRRLRGIVKSRLERAGYVESPQSSDFVVKLATGMVAPTKPNRDVERSEPTPALGYIGVHLYDAQTASMILQGSAVAEIDPAHIDDALLERGVEHMLSGLPTARKKLAASN
ncbi:MAG: DUF4136 domain-containing protein [Pseudomonadota bacterium]